MHPTRKSLMALLDEVNVRRRALKLPKWSLMFRRWGAFVVTARGVDVLRLDGLADLELYLRGALAALS